VAAYGDSIILITDNIGTIEYASNHINKILHYKPNDLRGRNLVEFTDSENILNSGTYWRTTSCSVRTASVTILMVLSQLFTKMDAKDFVFSLHGYNRANTF
jgi:hypothetical protein